VQALSWDVLCCANQESVIELEEPGFSGIAREDELSRETDDLPVVVDIGSNGIYKAAWKRVELAVKIMREPSCWASCKVIRRVRKPDL
jgi:hypothetical protein